jgi:hypothetical protein
MFKKKYALDPEDLPIPNGPNIVVIEGVDTEEFKNDEGETVTRTVLTLVGFSVPLRLNNEKIDTLAAMFGSNIEDAIGQKITLLSSFANIYGKTKPVIDIHPHVPDAEAVPVIVPSHLGCKSVFRMQRAMEYGVRIASPNAALPRAGARPPGAAQPGAGGGGAAAPVKQLTAATLGKERAAKLLQLLRVKNRTWTWLADALARDGMGELIIGKEPFDAAPAVAQLAWSKLKPLPDVGEVGTPEAMAAELAATVAAWEPPPAPPAPPAPAPAAGDVIDRNTGEVQPGAGPAISFKPSKAPAPAVNDDDIPF